MRIDKSLCTVALVLLSALHVQGSQAQVSYPNKPVRVIVTFPAGSATDIVARTIGEKLTAKWKQPVTVDNRPGAGGNLGTELASNAPADGYTILMGTIANAISAGLYSQLNYDFLRDFIPVMLVVKTPLVLVVNSDNPSTSVEELVTYAKARGQPMTFASGGVGTSNHLAGEMFHTETGVPMVHVPYKGTPAAHTDLIAGRVTLMFDNIMATVPHIKSGKLKPLAITSNKRAEILPQVRTVAESGLPGFEAVSWISMVVPAGTPKSIIATIHRDVTEALAMPDVKERLAALGAELAPSSPEELDAYTRAEIAKWGKIIKQSGARAE